MFKNKYVVKRMLLVVFLPWLGGLTACRTAQQLPPLNLTESGWTTRQGQAVWRSKKGAPEISGELILATHTDGRSFVQFTKTPLPFVVAQTGTNFWQAQFVPNNKIYSGHGQPPARLVWLQLPRCLLGITPPKPWSWQRLENHGWRLENRFSGELLEGYFTE
jgi:hypothetical protein